MRNQNQNQTEDHSVRYFFPLKIVNYDIFIKNGNIFVMSCTTKQNVICIISNKQVKMFLVL